MVWLRGVAGVLLFLSGAVFAGAVAADDNNWWFEAEGAYEFWDGDRNVIGDGTGRISPDDGFSVSGEVGYRQPDGPYNFRAALKYGESGRSTASSNSVSSGGTVFLGANVDNEEHFVRADAMVGRQIPLGFSSETMAELVGGIRFLSYKAKNDGRINDTLVPAVGPDHVDRTFVGAGPRLGIETQTRIAERTYLDFDLTGALLIGERKFKKDLHAYLATSGAFLAQDRTTRTKTKLIPNIEAFAGVTWQLPDSHVRLTGGYAVDAYFGLLDAGCSCFFDKGDRIFHGPRLKAKVPF